MSENPSTPTNIDAYDLFVDTQFLASHPKNSFTLASAKRLTSEEGVELEPRTDPTVVVFSEFEHPSLLAGPRRGPRTALWGSGEHVLLGDQVGLPGVPQGTQVPNMVGRFRRPMVSCWRLPVTSSAFRAAPICLGATDDERQARFKQAFNGQIAQRPTRDLYYPRA